MWPARRRRSDGGAAGVRCLVELALATSWPRLATVCAVRSPCLVARPQCVAPGSPATTIPVVDDATLHILEFLDAIGLPAKSASLDGRTFLPGLAIEAGTLVYDVAKLTYPGDLLHESGHIAFTPAAERPLLTGESTWELGEELAAIAWSYAAALRIGIDPAVVFHGGGYQGSSSAFIENFGAGRYVGVSMLQWAEMAEEKTRKNDPAVAYPRMLKWLRG